MITTDQNGASSPENSGKTEGREQVIREQVIARMIHLREFVNYRHPGPRRVWKGGSVQQFVTPFPVDPVDPVDPARVPKYGFTIVKQHFSSQSMVLL